LLPRGRRDVAIIDFPKHLVSAARRGFAALSIDSSSSSLRLRRPHLCPSHVAMPRTSLRTCALVVVRLHPRRTCTPCFQVRNSDNQINMLRLRDKIDEVVWWFVLLIQSVLMFNSLGYANSHFPFCMYACVPLAPIVFVSGSPASGEKHSCLLHSVSSCRNPVARLYLHCRRPVPPVQIHLKDSAPDAYQIPSVA
jgi:hypothetical protein